jgi:uncharacterized membrane protein YebE (DUF533 family)
MSFGNILGQIMQQGLGQGSPTRSRMDNLSRNLGGGNAAGGGGLDGLLGQLQGALSRAGIDTGRAQQSGTGLADRARDFLKQDQVGGMSGAQVGGIGALAGTLLGGGLGGAARGGAMAVLGTLALSALKRGKAGSQGGDASAGIGAGSQASSGSHEFVDADIQSLASPESEKLAVRAMISAAKADGAVDKEEIGRVLGKLDSDSVSEEERAFVMAELQAPVDIQGLAAAARTPAQAAEIYAASLLAINVDTDQERSYLAELARALRLDREAVAHLHQMTGAPLPA